MSVNKVNYDGTLTPLADLVQYATIPTASADNLGKIFQYIGITTNTYTNGCFYKCVSDGASTPTYSWEAIDTMTVGSLAKKNSASGSYTPAGSVSFTDRLDISIDTINSVGTLPTFSYDSSTENLTFTQGTLPTTFTNSVVSDLSLDFTGTAGTVTVS